MKRRGRAGRCLLGVALVAGTCWLSGCMTGDEATSIYLFEDGKVDLVVFMDNVRSDAEAPERPGEQSEWLADFNAGTTHELKTLKDTQAKDVQAVLLKSTAPFSAVVRASYDSVEGLGKYLDLNTDDDQNTITLTKTGAARRLAFHIEGGTPDAKRASQKKTGASGGHDEPNPVLKIIPVNGSITRVKACKTDPTSSSCTLDIAEIARQSESNPRGYDFFVEWTVH